MPRVRGGFGSIIAATAVAGLCGYALTLVVYRELGAETYAVFAVFWAALYLIIGGLSGIQQEITRATRSVDPAVGPHSSTARNFAAAASAGILLIVLVSSPLWQDAVFPGVGWPLVLPLSVGAASYVLVAVLSGSLYGLSRWRALSAMIALDGIVRLVLVGVGVAATGDPIVLAWLVAVPFPLVIALVWPFLRRSFAHRTRLDVGYRALSWNALRTVLASVSTAVLVSGFPLLLGVASGNVAPALLGELIFTVTLARAPLIITVMSLQSYFVVKFRESDFASRLLWSVVGIILASALVLSVLAWWAGPAVFSWVSGTPTVLGGGFVAVLVVSSGLVGILSVLGASLLADSRHYGYSAAWAIAALVTIIALVPPIDFLTKVEFALISGPGAGILVCGMWLFASRFQRLASEVDSSGSGFGSTERDE